MVEGAPESGGNNAEFKEPYIEGELDAVLPNTEDHPQTLENVSEQGSSATAKAETVIAKEDGGDKKNILNTIEDAFDGKEIDTVTLQEELGTGFLNNIEDDHAA